MSFLHRVRFAFSGLFQADVSTVNNDVRHYDSANFQASYQEFPDGGHENGWWNPTGSGAFRLLGCRISGVWYADGTSTNDPSVDPLISLSVIGADDRTSGKLVDVDPQWQLASALWGLEVRLTDGRGTDWARGRYLPNAFRDLWFSRNPNERGDRAASATFQSVLEGLIWSEQAVASSRGLRELREATADGRLSLRMATFGYHDSVNQPGFTTGTLIGAVGPYLAGEPASFVRGRRFTPAKSFSSVAGMTWFSGAIDADSSTVLLDLSNALQIADKTGAPIHVGTITLGALKDPSLRENTPVTADTFERIATIPYTEDQWLQRTGGVFVADLTPAQLALVQTSPLALVVESERTPGVASSTAPVLGIRESDDGLFVGIEPSVIRVEAGGEARATIHASRYGHPLTGVTVQVAQIGPSSNQGGGSDDAIDPPTSPIPDIGTPADKLSLPTSVETGPNGTAALVIGTQDPGNPRRYLDGQIYLIDYRLPGQSDQARSAFDYLVLHLRDAFRAPDRPTWQDVEPILIQYSNLYPIMSKRLVNLSNPVDVRAHAALLLLAFTRDINDPNYMPVTRDLSEPKRQMLVTWLQSLRDSPDPDLDAAVAQRQTATPSRPGPEPGPPADQPPPEGSKTAFARKLGHLTPRGRS